MSNKERRRPFLERVLELLEKIDVYVEPKRDQSGNEKLLEIVTDSHAKKLLTLAQMLIDERATELEQARRAEQAKNVSGYRNSYAQVRENTLAQQAVRALFWARLYQLYPKLLTYAVDHLDIRKGWKVVLTYDI